VVLLELCFILKDRDRQNLEEDMEHEMRKLLRQSVIISEVERDL
jgi:hypothetical protein